MAHVTAGKKKLVCEKVKLTQQQTMDLLNMLPSDVSLICMVALFGTCRISEILGARWKNVDLTQGVLRTRERYYRGDMDVVKTAASERDVQLGYLVEPLREMYPGPGHGDEFVFNVRTYVGHDKKPRITRDDRSIHANFLRPAAEKLGVYVPGFGFHAFRREAVTTLGQELGPLQAQRAAGHTRADMSLLYTLADAAAQKQAVEKLQDRMGGKVVAMRKRVG